jgi:hypothetical protein
MNYRLKSGRQNDLLTKIPASLTISKYSQQKKIHEWSRFMKIFQFRVKIFQFKVSQQIQHKSLPVKRWSCAPFISLPVWKWQWHQMAELISSSKKISGLVQIRLWRSAARTRSCDVAAELCQDNLLSYLSIANRLSKHSTNMKLTVQ